jgi:hypothetical protein
MHDPFPIAPPAALARKYVQPAADYLGLKTLPLHFHEVILAFVLYDATNRYLAPAFSRFFFPRIYATFNARTKLNWDVHIVSFVQSTLICVLALYVMKNDRDRAAMSWEEKVHGYTGASGLIQGFAAGYFVWDLAITLQNVRIFGLGMLAHAVSALFVFSLGFVSCHRSPPTYAWYAHNRVQRPFVNFYAPTFILYELSSPFLNIHWFCDKLNLTGSKIQLYNGIFLLSTFFSCRLCWGTYQSFRVFYDVYRAIQTGAYTLSDPELGKLNNSTAPFDPTSDIPLMQFAGDRSVPVWLAVCYLGANLTLNGLNWFWFGKMIETIRKRFDPPLGTRKPEKVSVPEVPEDEKVLVEGIGISTPGVITPAEDYVKSVNVEKGATSLRVHAAEARNRTGAKLGTQADAA